MKELFPVKQVMGFVFSLILTAVALLVYFTDMSFSSGYDDSSSNCIYTSWSSASCIYACW